MRDAHERGQGIGVDHAYLALTVLELGAGRYDAALRAARRVVDHDSVGVAPLALADLVEAAARCGEMGVAERALERLSERATASGTPWASGMLARKQVSDAWAIAFGGALLVLLAGLLVIDPGAGAIGITWAIGWFAFLFGIVQLWLASVVRHETHELTRPTRIQTSQAGHAVG